MAEETHYTANTGMVQISTANTSVNGSGTMGTVITGASNGTLVKSITIKAIGDTTLGMVRLFIRNPAGNKRLYDEIKIPIVNNTSTNPAFEISYDCNIWLESGWLIVASTNNAETFNVIAEGMDWSYYSSDVRPDTTQRTANLGRTSISTANGNLDGTGTLGTAFTAGSSSTFKGSSIRSITIKSTVNVTSGMVRLFFEDDSQNKFLFKEIMVETDTKSGLDEAFDRTVLFEDDFDLQADYSILVSTENAENFRIVVEATDWNYAS